ncbi:DinB family protein [Armatimonas sp.]|uniref:DinB family protein n=1 Tax=Armatimonas sp. TaxID=1872638 RepID=UPI003752C314
MTVQEFQAEKIEGSAKLLAFWLGSMPEDKQSWVPDVSGSAGLRTAREQVAECAAANRFFAALLKGEKPPLFRPFEVKSEYTSLEAAEQDLITSAAECAAVIRGMSDADLEKEYRLRRSMTGYQIIDFPYRNMAYHAGQINQLQLLYGDTEFHIPKG